MDCRRFPMSALARMNSARRFYRITFIGGIIFLLLGASQARAQDVAEMARQEKLRKENLPRHTRHVYTNDDLARPQILTQDDRQELQSRIEGDAAGDSASAKAD